jgi:hypothetical protein
MIKVLFIAMTSSVVCAQWSDSPVSELAICSASGEQAITKIAATNDGGCYISWFDNRGGGYDVYMQRLDAGGNPLWQSDGILIADRNYSSTMDFDLDIDAFGNAIVVYRKNMFTGDGVYATLVNPAGVIQWNTLVQPSGTFVASPVVTAVENDIVVGWISDEVSKFQRLNAKGTPQWPSPLILSDPAGGSLQVADIHESLDGSVITSFVQYTSFWGNKVLKAQRIASNGSTVWPELVSVMFDNSLQMGAYPDFISDGTGGGFFTWYGVGPLQSYAMKISSDGNFWFAGQVQVASTVGATERVNPVAVRDGNEFVVFFRSLDNGQNNDGIGAQRLSSVGGLLWGNAGLVLKPTSSSPQYGSFATAKTDIGTTLFFDESASFGNGIVTGVSLDTSGNTQWTPSFSSVASTPSSKSRMVAASTGDGVLLAWQDDRSGANDIYGQRVNSDGSLGNSTSCAGDIDGDGVVGVIDLLTAIGVWGPCSNCNADIDGDGNVGVSDLLSIIGQWGDC